MKKYKLTTNLPLKIIAFVFAAFLWLIVANVANPVTKSTYTNIKVTIANDDVITQGGEVYTVLDDQNVNVVVYAKRSVIQQIKSDDIVATADINPFWSHPTSCGRRPIHKESFLPEAVMRLFISLQMIG